MPEKSSDFTVQVEYKAVTEVPVSARNEEEAKQLAVDDVRFGAHGHVLKITDVAICD